MPEGGPREKSSTNIRFGVFEADCQTGELRRGGVKVKLQEKPFQVLRVLLERAGEMTSREELRARLWPAEAYGDFDRSLTIAMNKLRTALGDSAENPRFIETLPRRGYRFIAHVQSDPSIRESEKDTSTSSPVIAAPEPERTQRTRGRYGFFASCCALVSLAGMVFTGLSKSKPAVTGYSQITNDGRLKRDQITTDGSRLYFTESAADMVRLVQVSESGGEVVPIPNFLKTPIFQDVRPDHGEALVIDIGGYGSGALWALPLVGGAPRRVGDLMAYAACWSPDGQKIAYADRDGLYIAGFDGSGSRRIARLPQELSFLRWAPAGNILRFTLSPAKGDAASLWQIGVDGLDFRRISLGMGDTEDRCCGAWTSDGKYYVFQARHQGRTDLWAAPEENGILQWFGRGPQAAQLTRGPLDYMYPQPGTNGKTLFALGERRRSELARYDVKSRQLVPYLPGTSADQAGFSKGGDWVTYITYPDEVLWKSRTDGTERVQLTTPPLRVGVPRWSPDGKRIAFMGRAPGEPWRIYTLPATGGQVENWTPRGGDYGGPTWSPDGNGLIFGDLLGDKARATAPSVIHLIDLKTRCLSTLPGSNGLWSARWSPDGRHVAALTTDSRTLMLFDFQNRHWTKLLTTDPVSDLNWSHQGNSVYFSTAAFQKSAAVFRAGLDGRKVERITGLDGLQRLTSWWLGLMPDDSPLIQRDVGPQEIYSLDVNFP